ncbi:hypothetical protein KSF73_16250 [Burkholderiaceae bacterium DAT-1]|nr:hypothetical protein [Burkholderiaceae bacterium DAT-1]
MRSTGSLADKPMLNARIPAELASNLAKLQQATGRSKTELTIEALSRYVEAESWQIQEIQSAIVEADRGEFAPDDEVKALFGRYAD